MYRFFICTAVLTISLPAFADTPSELAPHEKKHAGKSAKTFLESSTPKTKLPTPTNRPIIDTKFRDDFDLAHGTYAGLSGIAGGAAGLGFGLIVGYATEPDCKDADSAFGCLNQFDHVLTLAGTGYLFAVPLGVYVYGQGMGFDGSYWLSFVGNLGTLALGGGLIALTGGTGDSANAAQKLVVYSAPILGVASSVLAYRWSLPEGKASSRSTASRKPTFGIPSFSYADEDGDQRFMLRFVGGHF